MKEAPMEADGRNEVAGPVLVRFLGDESYGLGSLLVSSGPM